MLKYLLTLSKKLSLHLFPNLSLITHPFTQTSNESKLVDELPQKPLQDVRLPYCTITESSHTIDRNRFV